MEQATTARKWRVVNLLTLAFIFLFSVSLSAQQSATDLSPVELLPSEPIVLLVLRLLW